MFIILESRGLAVELLFSVESRMCARAAVEALRGRDIHNQCEGSLYFYEEVKMKTPGELKQELKYFESKLRGLDCDS